MTAHEQLRWRKSSRSNNTGANCVEIAVWRKSSRSSNTGDNCVELSCPEAGRAVRDSKNPAVPPLIFGPTPFADFLRSLDRN